MPIVQKINVANLFRQIENSKKTVMPLLLIIITEDTPNQSLWTDRLQHIGTWIENAKSNGVLTEESEPKSTRFLVAHPKNEVIFQGDPLGFVGNRYRKGWTTLTPICANDDALTKSTCIMFDGLHIEQDRLLALHDAFKKLAAQLVESRDAPRLYAKPLLQNTDAYNVEVGLRFISSSAGAGNALPSYLRDASTFLSGNKKRYARQIGKKEDALRCTVSISFAHKYSVYNVYKKSIVAIVIEAIQQAGLRLAGNKEAAVGNVDIQHSLYDNTNYLKSLRFGGVEMTAPNTNGDKACFSHISHEIAKKLTELIALSGNPEESRPKKRAGDDSLADTALARRPSPPVFSAAARGPSQTTAKASAASGAMPLLTMLNPAPDP